MSCKNSNHIEDARKLQAGQTIMIPVPGASPASSASPSITWWVMDSATAHQWFLRKHEDGTVFGPLSFTQLSHWASSAQVAPNDAVSSDQLTWIKAPMLPELCRYHRGG